MSHLFFNKLIDIIKAAISSLMPSNYINNSSETASEPNAQDYTGSKVRYVTKASSPEEYSQFLNTIKTTIGQGGDKIAVDKLNSINIVLLLSVDDWIEMYISNYNSSPKNKIMFDLDPSTVSPSQSGIIIRSLTKKINSFLDTMLNKLNNHNTQDTFDIPGLKHLLEECINQKLICAVPEKGEMSFSAVIEKLDYKINDMISYSVLYQNKVVGLKELKRYLVDFSTQNTNDIFDKLVAQVNPASSLFSSLEDKRKFIHYDNFKSNLKEILDKSSSLTPDLLEKISAIVELSNSILDNDWTNLTVEEKHRFKVSIEQDIPSLIFNYLSLPVNIRENLVEKGTDISLKDMLHSSFDKILADFSSMDKSSHRQEQSVQEIQKTTRYLNARN